MRMRSLVAVTLACLLLVPAAHARSADKLLQLVFDAYAKAWRWGTPEQLVDYQEPDFTTKHPSYKFELERLRQYQVGNYVPQGARRTDEEHAEQIVAIDLINVHTQAVHTIVDRQVWRYDKKTKHWWLTSGLPDPAPGQP